MQRHGVIKLLVLDPQVALRSATKIIQLNALDCSRAPPDFKTSQELANPSSV